VTPHGKWNVTIDTPVGRRSGVLDLTVDGSRLTGSLSDGEHFVEILEGTIRGNQLEWSAKLTKPMRLTVKFTASVQGDRIEGRAKYLLGSGAFFGSRA
jgi:hypothetical protein